jgi:formylglycine-generating enzyme required for sulfatase activity
MDVKLRLLIYAGAIVSGTFILTGCEGKEFSDKDLTMVFVEGGTFTMGCTPEQGDDCLYNEKPAHSVTVSDFHIGKYPVTQRLWRQVMGDNPSDAKGNNLPVENVSWYDAQEFIKALNRQTGKKYRLPTEAEWEYAARGGNRSKGYKYSGSDNIDEVAWYVKNSGLKVKPVGAKKPNELGIYDMSGNVAETVNDSYGEYSEEAETNPQGPSEPMSPYDYGIVFRACGSGASAERCRVASRYHTPRDDSRWGGFRLALDP